MKQLLIAFCVGIATTLVWQSYGDAARGMIASSYPQLHWLAPQSAVETTAAAIAPPIPTSPNPDDLKTISLSLAAMRQRIDEIATSQEQTTRDFNTKLQVVKQEILDNISAPSPQTASAPARKPVSPAPQVGPVR